MDRTDRHFRFFLRQLTKKTLLYTEMKTANAILRGDRKRLLGYSDLEHPLALQVGGSDPTQLSEVARIATDYGYDELNLNVGCPSSRVRKGAFGACLMAKPELVAECVNAMRSATHIPVTVKHRIGIDEIDTYEDMERFVSIVAESACDRFSVHARKAWLKGLSPKQNRTIPPLRYPEIYRLKQRFPHLPIEINGGIRDHDAIAHHLQHVDAVMIGRAAYETPYLFAEADQRYFSGTDSIISREDAVRALIPYASRHVESGEPLHRITRHLLTLFVGIPGTKAWKRALSQPLAEESPETFLENALEAVRRVRSAESEVTDPPPIRVEELPPGAPIGA